MTQTIAPPKGESEQGDSTSRRGRSAGQPRGPRRWLVSGIALILVVAAWAAAAAWVDDPIVPKPYDVFERVIAITVSGEAFTNFASSITKIVTGFLIAMVGGLLIGFVMGRSKFMTSYFSLPLFVLGNMPGLTYAVFGLLLFGVGPAARSSSPRWWLYRSSP